MCGIVGIITPVQSGFTQDEVKAFTDMLFVDTLRGWDSTGVFVVDSDHDVEILKGAYNGPEFIGKSKYKELMSTAYMRGRMMIGHNRAATRGTVNDKNAHPFWVEDNVVLVQNGTWFGDHKHIKDTEVDSEAIAHLVHDHQDDLQNAFNKINAAYALIWYNRDKKTLYVTRNDDRPLHIAYLDNGVIMFASEKSTIEFAVNRQGLKLKEAPYQLKEDNLNMWTFNKKGGFNFSAEEYKPAPKSSQPTWIYKSQWYPSMDCAYDYSEYNYENHPLDRSTNTPQLTHNKKKEALDPNDFIMAFADYVAEGRFPDAEMHYATSAEVLNALKVKEDDHKFAIEFSDYIPGNHRKDCQAWYLLGQILVEDTDPLKQVLIYIPMVHKTEQEIIDMVTENMFICKLNAKMSRYVQRANKYCVTAIATELKAYEVIDAN
jgi:hypothetical protein